MREWATEKRIERLEAVARARRAEEEDPFTGSYSGLLLVPRDLPEVLKGLYDNGALRLILERPEKGTWFWDNLDELREAASSPKAWAEYLFELERWARAAQPAFEAEEEDLRRRQREWYVRHGQRVPNHLRQTPPRPA